MTAEEFAAKRHLSWDRGLFGELEQGFCVCDTPEAHVQYVMDSTGSLARRIVEETP